MTRKIAKKEAEKRGNGRKGREKKKEAPQAPKKRVFQRKYHDFWGLVNKKGLLNKKGPPICPKSVLRGGFLKWNCCDTREGEDEQQWF